MPGLFSRSSREPEPGPRRTINGNPQPDPERPGSVQRRARLFVEAMRRIAEDPLASPSACGVPIGDGCGMEQLVARIAPLFDDERSLLRWVALRGAFTYLHITTVDGASRDVPFHPVVEAAMGVGNIAGSETAEPVIDVAPQWSSRLSADQREAAIGVFSALAVRLFDYGRYSELTIDQVNEDPRCRLSDAMALDFIAWASVALLRTGLAQKYLSTSEPDELEQPGWYTDPLWAKAQRYWDGTDWTEQVRTGEGREGRAALRPSRPEPLPTVFAGASLAEILSEWEPQSPVADLTRWREGMARFDAASVEDRAEMRASAELMCAALTHYLLGDNILSGFTDAAGELTQTTWNVLVVSLIGNDQTTWDAEVERHVRLALASARRAGFQPETMGGRGTFDKIFDDHGNQMLMQAALWDLARSGPKSFTLKQWFTSASDEHGWGPI